MLDFFRRKALVASPEIVQAANAGNLNLYQRLGGASGQVHAALLQAQSASYAHLYQSQPSVRSVIDYIARNVAQLRLDLYEMVTPTEREMRPDHPAAETMAHPNDFGPSDEFIFGFVADYLVHENAYALKLRGNDPRMPRMLIRIPPVAVAVNGFGFSVDSYRIYRADGSFFEQPPENIIHWRGYDPTDVRLGFSKLQTLRNILAEDAASQAANLELLLSGLSMPGVIERPLEAAEWSPDARKRFSDGWANAVRQSSRRTPVLEEGMKFADFGVSPKDAQMLDGRRFTVEEVAREYGVPPGVLGLQPAGDLEEQRRQVYQDVLPPICGRLAKQLCFSILEVEYAETDFYFQFDLDSKLQGDPEIRYPSLTAAAGRPWLTPNEVRARENLPPVDGGDELTVPMNVVTGNNPMPAPNVMPIQDPNAPPQDGSYRPQGQAVNGTGKQLHPRRRAIERRRNTFAAEFAALLLRDFTRQERQFKSVSRKGASWGRRDAELAADLLTLSKRQIAVVGETTAARILSSFDMKEVQNYLAEKAKGTAEGINATTRADIEAMGAEDAFARAKDLRAPAAGMNIATDLSAWGTKEAIRQAGTDHTVSISGGDCEVCAEFQGDWRFDEVPGWPAYHQNCNCIADVV